MATNRIKGITIEIDGNVTKLQSALDKTNKDLKTTQGNLKDVNKLLKFDPDNVELLRQKQKLLNDAIKGVNDRLEKEKEALRQLSEADQTPEVVQHMDDLKRQIADDESYLKHLQDESKNFGSVAVQQFKLAGDKVKAFGDKVGAAGEKLAPLSAGAAAIGGGLLKLGYDAVTGADDLNTLSKQTGISTAELQKFQYASDLIDVSLDDMTGALKKMKPKMTENNAVFKELGVSVTDADGNLRNANDVFYDAVDALSKIENETERDQVSMQLFGKSADSLAGIIDDGGAALRAYGEEAQNMGLILDQDTLDSLNATNDTIDQLKATVTGTMAQIGADVGSVLGPALESAAGFIQDITAKLRELTPEQTEMILKIVGIVAAIAPLLIIGGKLIAGVGSLIGIVGKAVGAIQTVITVLGGPLTIAIAAAIAIGVLLWKNWDTIKEKATAVKEWVVDKWNGIKEGMNNAIGAAKQFASERLGAIKQAYQDAGGGIKGVISGAMTAVKQYFRDGFNVLNQLTGGKLGEIKDKFVAKFNAIKDFVKGVIDKIKAFFSFNIELPHIKLPHFSIQPPGWKLGDLLKGSIPSLGIEWYKRAYTDPVLFTSPTVVTTPGGLKGFGDGSGGELVYGRESLMRDIRSASLSESQIYNAMVAALDTADLKVVIGNREFGRILREQGAL